MSDLDLIVELLITVDSRAPSQAGFGTPLLFGYHTAWLGDLVREYSDPADMLEDGFTADDDLYKAARICKAQELSPATFKIGRRVSPLTQVIEITPTKTTEGFVYKGTVGGKALSYVVPAASSQTDVATGLAAAINALLAGCTAANSGQGSVLGTIAGPWVLAHNDTLLVSVDADVPASPDTATFTGTAAARESSSGPWNLSGGKTLLVAIDGGAAQTVSFVDGNFAVPTAATAAEVAAVIAAQLTGALVAVTSVTKVTITSDRKGTGSGVNVSGGTANAGLLAYTTGNIAGTGNVSNLAAVTFAEVQTIVEAATDAVVTEVAGAVKLTSPTTGAASKVLVAASSTADVKLGLDNATHTGAAAGIKITCTANTQGKVVSYDLLKGMLIADVTADSNTGDELADIVEEDDDFYGLNIIDSSSLATAVEVAAWNASYRRVVVLQTADDNVLDAGDEDDTLSTLKASSYNNTGGIYHRMIGGNEWLAVGWLAGRLPPTPGRETWAHKEVRGVKVDKLGAGAKAALKLKNGSHYTRTAGRGNTFEGKTASGEFFDTVRFTDWVHARMQESVIGLFQRVEKVPFTGDGADMIRSALKSVIDQGIANKGFTADPPPTITVPPPASVPLADRANRLWSDIEWSAVLAGAAHRTKIRGRISV